jgi:hypothetical protein
MSHGDESVRPGGFLHSVPAQVEEVLIATRMFGRLAWNVPALQGAAGHPPDDREHRKLHIAFEWPIPQLFVPESVRLQQRDLERLHLDRYCTHHLLVTGHLPYESEPEVSESPAPDFVFHESHGPMGVDCAQLFVPGRRNAHGSFKTIRRAILQQPRHRFARLAGLIIYMWFTEGDRLGLAYSAATRKAAISDAVDALAAYQPDRSLSWVEGDPPDPHPGLAGVTVGDCTFHGVPLDVAPPTPFFTRMGFELGMAYGTTVDAAMGWDVLAGLVADHDQPGYDHLLVTIGGPDRDGLAYPGEELLGSEMLREPPRLAKPDHLSKVILHSWELGGITEVSWAESGDARILVISEVPQPAEIVPDPNDEDAGS